jgi:hypothetical protein
MVAVMVSAVLLIVAVLFAAVSIERVAEAWRELMDTFRRISGDVE